MGYGMPFNVFEVLSFLIAGISFAWGMLALFRKKRPMYFRLFVFAAGCFVLYLLSYVVSRWCGIVPSMSIGAFSIFGAEFFLLSANYGTLDRLVDDGQNTKKARRLSWLAPLVIAALAAAEFFAFLKEDIFTAEMWVVIAIPAMAASYFNLKHLLLPMDDLELLCATRYCNVFALIFYVITAVYVIVSSTGRTVLSGLHLVMMSLAVFGMTVSAIKGSEKWEI